MFSSRSPGLVPILLITAGLLGLSVAPPTTVRAQNTPDAQTDAGTNVLDRKARVYLDCRFCDESYLRRNLTFVDWVRDRKQADVHMLTTTQQTGGGGASYQIEFIGRDAFDGIRFQLPYTIPPTYTDDQERQKLAKHIRIGLGPFVSRTSTANRISLTDEGTSDEQAARSPADDPWNQWVFEISADGRLSVEEQSQRYNLRGEVEASRVTEEWKLEFEGDTNYELDVFTPTDREETRSSSRDNAFDADVVKTLGPHWGAGISQRTFSRTATNKDFAARAEAAVEYNVFPYRISEEKEFTFTYRIGPEYNDYREETIYGKQTESLGQHSLEASLDLQQPWGSIFSSLRGSHYFHDPTKNRLRFRSFLELQLVEGLSLRLSVRAGLIQDQLFLPAGDLPEEEILLRRRELATNYQLNGSIGLSYTFGSIYNNVVNPRL